MSIEYICGKLLSAAAETFIHTFSYLMYARMQLNRVCFHRLKAFPFVCCKLTVLKVFGWIVMLSAKRLKMNIIVVEISMRCSIFAYMEPPILVMEWMVTTLPRIISFPAPKMRFTYFHSLFIVHFHKGFPTPFLKWHTHTHPLVRGASQRHRKNHQSPDGNQ